MRGWIWIVMLLGGCGRVGYERRTGADAHDLDAATDAAIDAATDAAPDAIDAYIPVCPTGMTELTVGSTVCIEQVERGNASWTIAKLDCEMLGRRLCADAEWYLGCTDAAGLVDMIDGGFEWVAEEAAGVAQKRGPNACTDISSHVVVDPYEFRCCAAKS
jgi:hypothetical protein